MRLKRERFHARQREFREWLDKLESLDHAHKSREMWSRIKRERRNTDADPHGSVRDPDNSNNFSTTQGELTEFWARYYEILYKDPGNHVFDPPAWTRHI